MKKKTKNLLFLLAALVVVVGALALTTLLGGDKKEEAPAFVKQSVKLNEIEAENVVSLSFDGPNLSLDIEKEDGTWKRTDDKDFPLNQDYVDSMVKAVAGLTAIKKITDEPADIAEFGLADPSCRVKITDNTGASFEVLVGERGPQGDGCFIKTTDSNTIYLGNMSLQTQYQYTETQMIAKLSTPTIEPAQITRILLEKPEGNFELSLEYGNELDSTGYCPWLIRQGFETVLPGNSDAVQAQVDNYATFPLGDALEYDCKDLGKYGLDPEHATKLTLTYYDMVDGDETDEIGNPIKVPEYHTFAINFGALNDTGFYNYVNLDGTSAVYYMKAETVTKMTELTPYDYVSKLPGLVNIQQVDDVTIEYQGKTHVMKLIRTQTEKENDKGEKETEEETKYYFDNKEVTKDKFNEVYTPIIGVKSDGLVDPENVKENEEPVIKITYDRSSEGLDRVVSEIYNYNDNFGRISVNGLSYFRINVRDIENLINIFESSFN